MKIGIDVSQIVHEGTGVATYTRELVKAITLFDRKNEYILFGTSLRKLKILKDFTQNLKASPRLFPIPPAIAEPLFNQFPRLRIELFTGTLDVFHSSDWLEPRAHCPKVTVVHDLAMFKYPETVHPKILATHKRKLALSKNESSLTIAVSEATKKDLIEILGFDPNKIIVIYEAAGIQFKPNKNPSQLLKYGISGKYLLALGTREPRKNLKRVIEAFIKLNLSNTKLVIAGKFGWGEDVKPVENVLVTGYVPENDLPFFYSGAEALVYPALYEGFGLPVLEAMSSGTAVVTSNVSSLPEVAGEAAVLVDPTSSVEIAQGIKRAIQEKEELIAKGILQAKKFSWQKTAQETLKAYEKATRG